MTISSSSVDPLPYVLMITQEMEGLEQPNIVPCLEDRLSYVPTLKLGPQFLGAMSQDQIEDT
jgi:hypothetical protein